MKKYSFLFFLIIQLGITGQQTKSALFLGNSYTASNNLPALVNSVANSVGNTLVYDANTPGGQRLMNHAANATSIAKIYSSNWDYVVLQAQSQEPSWVDWQVQQEVFPYAKILCDTIRDNNSCTEPLFFMTWGRENGDAQNCGNWSYVCTYEGMDSILNYNYRRMGQFNNAAVSPVGAVWHYLRDSTFIDLYSSDGSHPSAAGSYAAAITFYTVIFEEDPLLTSYDFTLSAADAQTIREAVKYVVYDDLQLWSNDTYYTNETVLADCDSVFYSGNYYTQSTAFYDTLLIPNMYGCDSINKTTISIETIDLSTSLIGDSIGANQLGASYQWIDCNNGNTEITGETSQYFLPTSNGSYAVVVTTPFCSDTSACVIKNNVGINDSEFNSTVGVYPNPTKGIVTFNVNYKGSSTIYIQDIGGRMINVVERNTTNFTVDLSKFTKGVYFLTIQHGEKTEAKRIIKL